MKIKEELCGRASKQVMVQYCQQIGMTYQRKIIKAEIVHHHQKVNNGRRDKSENDQNKL
jgi:hypothetical protein